MNFVDQQIQKIANHTVPVYAWVYLFFLFASVAWLFYWAIFGVLDLNVQGEGIVLNPEGLFDIEAPLDGTIKTLYVKEKDMIQKGLLLAEIYNADQEQLLRSTQRQIEALTEEVDRLTSQIAIEAKAVKAALEHQLASLETTIQLLNEQYAFLEPEYQKKEELYKKGLIILSVVQDAKRQMTMNRVSIQEKKSEILDIQAKLRVGYRTEELKNKELELFKAQQEARVILTTLQKSKIFSPYDGRILELLVSIGSLVKEGQPIINAEYENADNNWLFYGYFPSEFAKYIHQRDIMKMYLSNVNEKEFGAILGQVLSISSYSVSEKFLTIQLKNNNLARFLINKRPTTQVIALPIKDPDDPSGYRWTSFPGPRYQLTSGDVGKTTVAVESVHPIYYLFPRKEFKKSVSPI